MWKPVIEILILWVVIYYMMLFFEGTRGIQVLRGIVILLFAFFLFQKLGLEALDWLMAKLFTISVIAILVIFHPEIRQGLARLGQRHLFGASVREEELDYILKQTSKAAESICKDKFGALIAIEISDPLTAYIESGCFIDARVSADLIQAIFTPNNPLHDGGLVIQRGRIMAAGCLFPIAESHDLSRIYGTRHRAALGLSQETDAVLIIISEERQDMSLVYQGKLYSDINRDNMASKINEITKLKKNNA